MATAVPIPSAHWWVFLLEGNAAILFGILLLTAPAATVVAITVFLGIYWLFTACACSSIAPCSSVSWALSPLSWC